MATDSEKKNAGRKDMPMVLPRAFALLRLLAKHREGLSLSAISAELSAPKSSLSSTLRALSSEGYLRLQGTMYMLGPETFSLASAVLEGQTLIQIARPILEDLARESGETALLATLDSDRCHMTYVDIAESSDPIKYSVPIGTRRPLYATAGGQMFLAWFSDDERAKYWQETELVSFSSSTVLDAKLIESRLPEVRDNDISITRGEYSDQATGFACPIRDAKNELVAVLVTGAPTSRVQNSSKNYAGILVDAAGRISRTLGGNG